MINEPLVVRIFAEELRQRVMLFVRYDVVLCSANILPCNCTCGLVTFHLYVVAKYESSPGTNYYISVICHWYAHCEPKKMHTKMFFDIQSTKPDRL